MRGDGSTMMALGEGDGSTMMALGEGDGSTMVAALGEFTIH